MRVIKLRLGQLQTNCFLVIDRLTDKALIIDPGDEADFIISKIQEEEIKPTAIIASHGHFDHLMAVNELKLAFEIPFWLSKKDAFLIKRIRSSAQYFAQVDPGPAPQADGYLSQGDKICFGKEKLTVIETPGHTPGGISLYSKKEKLVFTGDTLFAGGDIGRTDYSYGDSQVLEKSIKRILKLPKETIIYPGHGEETTVEEERKIRDLR